MSLLMSLFERKLSEAIEEKWEEDHWGCLTRGELELEMEQIMKLFANKMVVEAMKGWTSE